MEGTYMTPEMKMNLILWEANNHADRAIESARSTLIKVNRRRVDIKTSLYGRRKEDKK